MTLPPWNSNFRIITLWNSHFFQVFSHFPYGIPPIFDAFLFAPMEFHCFSKPTPRNGNGPPQQGVHGFFLEKPIVLKVALDDGNCFQVFSKFMWLYVSNNFLVNMKKSCIFKHDPKQGNS